MQINKFPLEIYISGLAENLTEISFIFMIFGSFLIALTIFKKINKNTIIH